ncbi:hypothetical protein DFJ77DRAFT_460727 [Powellomyces hirtus]|nr:hypothetical protein DFJ77DRAFT_460727 [Powellomyces hirtus]
MSYQRPRYIPLPRPLDDSLPFLPNDVLPLVFHYLDMLTLARCQQTCRTWFGLLACHDEHLWKPKVQRLCAQNLLPRRREGELWKDIFETYHAWARPLRIRNMYSQEVPVLASPSDTLPDREDPTPIITTTAGTSDTSSTPATAGSSSNSNITASPNFEFITAFVSSRDEQGEAVLAPRRAFVCNNRIVYIRQSQMFSIQLDGQELSPEHTESTDIGEEPRIDADARSQMYAVVTSDCTIFRRCGVNSDYVCALLEQGSNEEGVLCGNIYAFQQYDSDLMRSSLALFHVPECAEDDVGRGNGPDCPPTASREHVPILMPPRASTSQHRQCGTADEADENVPLVEPFAVIDNIDDSLNAVIINDHYLAYRTWSSDRIHPIVVIRLKDQSEYATLLLDDMDENLILHLMLSRLHLIVLCGTGHQVYVYELATMQRIHSFNLFDLAGDLGSIDWVQMTLDENAIIFGTERGRLLWIDIRWSRAVLYYRATHEENSDERGLWIVYRNRNYGKYSQEQVACRIFAT